MGESGPALIRTAPPELVAARIAEFAALLRDCVHDGANIGFVLPFTEADAAVFWRERVIPPVETGGRLVWIAEIDKTIAGSVQLSLDTPPNQPHRAEVTKLLVGPSFRRRGIARALIRALEARARQLGRTLVTLDTRTGDKAEPLYASCGYRSAGTIPRYCRDPIEDRLYPTTIMYKVL